MTSRPGIRPSRLGLIARLAVTAAVGAGATAGAVLVRPPAADAMDPSAEARSSNLALATATAQRLLDAFTAPPGSSRLSAAPSGLAGASGPSIASVASAAMSLPYQVSKTSWWRAGQSGQSVDGLIGWLQQNPERGLIPSGGTTEPQSPPRTITFAGRATAAVLDSISLTVTAYVLDDASTALQVVATVGYVPPRPTSEILPAATTLIVVPAFAPDSKESAPEVTVTDAAEIARIEQIIDALPKAPSGTLHCPFDNGAGIALDFEDAQNSTLADVVVGALGCERVQVSISGYNEPVLSDGQRAAAQIQAILGTHWDLTQVVGG